MPTPEYYYAHTCPTSPSGQTYLVPRDDVDAMDAKFGHTNGVGLLIRQGQGIIDVVSIDLQSDKKLNQAIDMIEAKLANSGRILVRKSGTEPLVRVMVESANYDLAMNSAEELAEIIKSM